MPSPLPLLRALLPGLCLAANACLYGAGQAVPPGGEVSTELAAAERPTAIPCADLEELHYGVAWGAVPAGWLTVTTERDDAGFLLRAAGGSTGLAALLYSVDATLETQTDEHGWPRSTQLFCRQEEHQHLRHLSFADPVVVTWRDLRLPYAGNATVECPTPWDPLTLLAALRGLPQPESDAEFEVVLGRRAELYQVSYRGQAEVTVPAGSFPAAHCYEVTVSPVFTHTPRRRLGPGSTSYHLYLADDAVRTPLLLEYELRIGTLQVRLESAARGDAATLAP